MFEVTKNRSLVGFKPRSWGRQGGIFRQDAFSVLTFLNESLVLLPRSVERDGHGDRKNQKKSENKMPKTYDW